MEISQSKKREITLEKKYGPDWRRKIGQMAKKAREKKYGVELYSRAGRIGGAKRAPGERSFAKDNELAREAGKKGAAKRWGKTEC